MKSSSIKPSQINEILDLALTVRSQGGNYVPCFAGDAGIGKSEINQAWAKKNNLTILDLRMAYMEGPDLIGMPNVVTINGVTTTVHALPDFLPQGGKGLLLIEEPNRAHESMMNAMMQLLTDRKIHKYELPDGWVMAACINPEGRYTVNTMDPAMKNRFAMFDVKYDHNSFVDYIKSADWDPRLTAFIDKNWSYKSVEEVAEDGFYVSPRSLKQTSATLKAGAEKTGIFFEVLSGSLGVAIASDFHKFLKEIRPILLADFLEDEKSALKKTAEIVERKDYQGDLLAATVTSLIDGFKAKQINSDLVMKVAKVLTADHAVTLITECAAAMTEQEAEDFIKNNKRDFNAIKRRVTGKISEKKDDKEAVAEEAKESDDESDL